MGTTSDDLFRQYVETGTATIKRSYTKGIFTTILTLALIVGGIALGLSWMRDYPGEWYRFVPFVIALFFGYSLVTTIADMTGGDVTLRREGIAIGRTTFVRWSDIEQIQVQGTTTARGQKAFTALVKLQLGPGDHRKSVDLPTSLAIPSINPGPLIQKCLNASRG